MKQIILGTIVAFVLFVSAFVIGEKISQSNTPLTVGSVSRFSEYTSTTTKTFNGTSLATPSVLVLGPGTLGSITITGANTGVINIYDGTSTVTNKQTGTTTLATIPASTVAGTYTFDSLFTNGLVIEEIGLVPTSTITYRQN